MAYDGAGTVYHFGHIVHYKSYSKLHYPFLGNDFQPFGYYLHTDTGMVCGDEMTCPKVHI